MKRIFAFSIVFALAIFMLDITALSQGIKAQGKVGIKVRPAAPKPNKPQQKKPDKTYDLTPKFKNGMHWKEAVSIALTQTKTYDDGTFRKKVEEIKFDGQMKITEIKDKMPTKVNFDILSGEFLKKRERSDNPTSTSNRQIEKISTSASIDKNYLVKFSDMKTINLPESLVTVYPAGSFIGFMPPAKRVKVGEEWKSTKLVPLNLWLLQKENISLKIASSVFKLKSVDKKNSIEVATIVWTGSTSLLYKRNETEREVGKIKWSYTILFDITNKRVNSVQGKFAGKSQETSDIECKFSQQLKYPDAKAEKKSADIPDEPKDDE